MRSVHKSVAVVVVMAIIGIAALSWLYVTFLSREGQPQGATLVHSVISPLREVQDGTSR
ncbi:MAG: hypothetical protein DDT20_01335 [Firmicutes bacterium]|nr:hypothetical protein [Bacillota bacterium]